MSTSQLQYYLDSYPGQRSIHLVGPLAASVRDLREPVIFVDGGAAMRRDNIGIVVGDGDSYDGPLDHQLDPVKDYSDLAFALSLVGPGFDEIYLHGFLGGRRDHELLNLGEAYHFLDGRGEPAHLLLDRAVEAFSAGSWGFHCRGLFSLVVFAPTRLTMSGQCRYPIAPDTLVKPVSSLGLSNQGHGEIRLVTDGPAFIFRSNGDGS